MTDTNSNVSNNDIYKLLQDVLNKNIEIQHKIKENKDTLTSEINKLKQEFSNQLLEVRKENNELKKENKELKTKLNTIERRIKKYTIIVYGLKEEQDNIGDIQKLLKIFNETLNIKCNFADFRDTHRFGNNTEGKVRPIALEVFNFNLKSEILANAKKLKGTGIFLAQDYTSVDYNKRKVLHSNLKLARNCNLEAKIQNNILFIDQEEFTVEDLEREMPHKISQAVQTQEHNFRHSNTHEVVNTASGNSGKDAENFSVKDKETSTGTKRKQQDPEELKPKRSARLNSNKT